MLIFERSTSGSYCSQDYRGRADVPKETFLKGECFLKLFNVTRTDSGKYSVHLGNKVQYVELSVQDLSKIVRDNGEITLNCDIRDHEEVAWYRLRSDQLTLLISAQKTRTVKSLPVYYNIDKTRFILKADSEIRTAMFTIRNLMEDDLGLYFCGTTAEPAQMHFGNATRLKFEAEPNQTVIDVHRTDSMTAE
ncbi:hypothetical protein QTP70_010313 [Hemibagrus guttatus]|uniref:Immunoglobulin V-set domain-containing protein n=1 Tax=Hemibagrus guttatus TaxID=175788 RepID=A0AAE0QMX4_9TELE|nr:hypothetical protein QTP70_010313 [Hemibagrus guttatus]